MANIFFINSNNIHIKTNYYKNKCQTNKTRIMIAQNRKIQTMTTLKVHINLYIIFTHLTHCDPKMLEHKHL